MTPATESAELRARDRVRSSLLDPSPRLCWTALVVAWLAATALLLWLHRDLTYAVDEFDYSETFGAGSLEDMLAPQNGHLNVLPFLVFKLLYTCFGTELAPFVLLEGAMLAVLSAGLYLYARPRIGPLLGLLPAVMPLFLGTAWPMLMPPMIALLWLFAIAAGVWAFVLLERESRSADVGACLFLCVAVASFSLGLIFVAACALAIVLSPRRRQRIYVVAIPIAAWIAWYVWARKFGGVVTRPELIWLLPGYAVDSIAANTAALLGRNMPRSPATSLYLEGFAVHRLVFALALAAIELTVGVFVVSRIGLGKLSRRSLWVILVIPLAWWASQVIVLEEFRTPSSNRYFFAGVVILLLVAVEVARGIRLSPRTTAVVFAVAGVALAGNLLSFRHGRAELVSLSQEAKAITAMIELEGRRGDQEYVPSSEPLTPQSRFMFLTVGPYLDVAERYGPSGDALSEVAAAPEPIREAADTVAARLLRLRLAPADGAARGDCRRIRASASSQSVIVKLPRAGATLASPVTRPVFLGRFASGYPVRVGELTGSARSRLATPTDRSPRPWRLMAAGPTPLSVCPL